MVVLVGRIEVVVVEARQLTNLDAHFLRSADKSDPYCVVQVTGASGSIRIGKSHTIDDCLNPKWYYKINSDVQQDVSGLSFVVKDKDVLSSEVIGTCVVPVENFTSGHHFDGSIELISPKGKPAGTLFLNIKFSGTESVSNRNPSFHDKAKLKAGDISRRVSRGIAWSGAPEIDSFSFSQNEMSTFFHGMLEVEIVEAKSLPNLDSSLLSLKKKDVSDPYVVVSLEDEEGGSWKVCTTSVIDNNLNPKWNENFRVDVCHHVISITFEVKDKDFISSESMGTVKFTADSLFGNGSLSGLFDLITPKGKKAGQLKLSITYRSKVNASCSPEVPDCLYPMRQCNTVRLYQDAHCPSLPVPVSDLTGQPYPCRRAWYDLHNTINEAQHFIYIVGWSVSTKVCLLRWEGEDPRTLGEMLLHKSNQGVSICLMLWDELTSNDLRKTGTMSTEDEDTLDYFKGSTVKVVLAPRDRYTKDLFSTKNPFTKMCYTHHQKVVIADSANQENPSKRHIVAYVGGLDLTGGRFDTPEHPLFRTLVLEHKHDYRNRMHASTSASGPREPWHDIHSRVEGPIALDLFANFEERWSKQGDANHTPPLTVPLRGVQIDYSFQTPDSWNVQMFRSINSDSAIFNWQTVIGDALTHKKGRAFDNSLHRAYIHQIRRSDRFIYIENQYFLGSSHVWLNCRDAKAGNLVPLEITSKIEEKIYQGKQFTAYIVIPMFPEGKPADKVTQEILHWQFRTIEMMYSRVGAALCKMGSDAHPQDYLLFFCLGKKEDSSTFPNSLVPPEDPAAATAFVNKRLMIYVHSKMAIFDDEYIIVGSANINDRSLSGNRDSEIAIGAYQPNAGQPGTGQVGGFRRSLWAEHLGSLAPLQMDPGDWQCARRMKDLAERGLEDYMKDDEVALQQHLLLYPLNVGVDGRVSSYPNCTCFPDTNASVMGARSKVFPSSLTT
uniref:phospholipase D n=1 Tax=Hirondellea gigas TaxID=1518452 RepID=A0A2P2HX20_9CRUS